jgi:putative lipoic acid-binding regulatory protein
MSTPSPFQFPCDFPIKAMGYSAADFQDLVAEIVSRHAPDLDMAAVRVQASRSGRYQSVTLTIRARSREQLDALYRELSGHARVLLAL